MPASPAGQTTREPGPALAGSGSRPWVAHPALFQHHESGAAAGVGGRSGTKLDRRLLDEGTGHIPNRPRPPRRKSLDRVDPKRHGALRDRRAHLPAPIETAKLTVSSRYGDGIYANSTRIAFSFFAFRASAGKSTSRDCVA